jgi:hypothetical protein
MAQLYQSFITQEGGICRDVLYAFSSPRCRNARSRGGCIFISRTRRQGDLNIKSNFDPGKAVIGDPFRH